MKKILFAYDLVAEDNEYVKRLFEIVSSLNNIEVYSGLNEFWLPSRNYDYIFINWPDYLFGWRTDVTDSEVEQLKITIKKYKTNSTILINVRHDTYPHTDKSKNAILIYDLFNRDSDIIIHLGDFSKKEFLEKYGSIQNQKHYLMPHPLFKEYDYGLNREKLREIYKLKKDDCFIFVPGNIRSYDEFKLAISLYQRIRVKNKCLHFQKVQLSFFPTKAFTIRYAIHFLKTIFLYRRKKISYGFKYLDSKVLSELFTISDLIIIPRFQNLNSGNITLSAQFNKPFIAVESGNITEWTKHLDQRIISQNANSKESIRIDIQNHNLKDKIFDLANDEIISKIITKILNEKKSGFDNNPQL